MSIARKIGRYSKAFSGKNGALMAQLSVTGHHIFTHAFILLMTLFHFSLT